jgi:CheY-like chemotaxis protein
MTADVEVLVGGLTAEERREFFSLGEVIEFGDGEVILAAGRSEWDIYFIEEGEVSVWVGNARLADLGPGKTLGTSAILFPQLQWSAVRGNGKGVLRRMLRESVMSFFDSRPKREYQQFCVNIFKLWVEVLSQRNERIAEIQEQILNVSSTSRKGRFKLMVVDDELDIRIVMEEYFKRNYDIVTAKDGIEAVERILAEKPDLVLLDLRLPGADGYSVCQKLKTHPQTGNIPVIMLTALSSVPDRVKGMMYGADEYLTKPVDMEQLEGTIERILARAYGE